MTRAFGLELVGGCAPKPLPPVLYSMLNPTPKHNTGYARTARLCTLLSLESYYLMQYLICLHSLLVVFGNIYFISF
jgi:hypothetical protein